MSKIIKISLILLAFLLFLSCSNSNVAGGFGSETSSGVAVIFDSSAIGDTGSVRYEVYRSSALAVGGVSVQPVDSGLVPFNHLDSVMLPSGEYTIVSQRADRVNRAISQHVSVDAQKYTEVQEHLSGTGVLRVSIPKSEDKINMVLFIKGTPLLWDSTHDEESLSATTIAMRDLPEGEYDSLLLYDESRDKVIRKVYNSFIINPHDTTTIIADSSTWDIPQYDGVVTVNWKLRTESLPLIEGKNDTVITYLISANYDALRKGGSIDSVVTYDAEATVTFSGVKYGEYNLVTSSEILGYHATISLVVDNNQAVIVSDTLRPPATLEVQLTDSQKSKASVLVIQGTDYSVILDSTLSTIVLDSLPVGLTSTASIVDGTTLVGTSSLFNLTEGVVVSVSVH